MAVRYRLSGPIRYPPNMAARAQLRNYCTSKVYTSVYAIQQFGLRKKELQKEKEKGRGKRDCAPLFSSLYYL